MADEARSLKAYGELPENSECGFDVPVFAIHVPFLVQYQRLMSNR